MWYVLCHLKSAKAKVDVLLKEMLQLSKVTSLDAGMAMWRSLAWFMQEVRQADSSTPFWPWNLWSYICSKSKVTVTSRSPSPLRCLVPWTLLEGLIALGGLPQPADNQFLELAWKAVSDAPQIQVLSLTAEPEQSDLISSDERQGWGPWPANVTESLYFEQRSTSA